MKLKEFQEILSNKKIDAAVFISSPAEQSLKYFTNISVETGALVVPALKQPFLIIPGFEYDRIRQKTTIPTLKSRNVWDVLKQKLKRAKRIGINEHGISLGQAEQLRKTTKARLENIGEIIHELRLTKTQEEIRLISQACKISCEIINECIEKFAGFKTEQEVDRFLRTKTAEYGCGLSFPPIVASGPNAATPHHEPKGKLNKGITVLDFGATHQGYCSDITRTIALGNISLEEKEAYDLLKRTQEWAIRQAKPGTNFKKLHDTTTKHLGKYGKNFTHGLGHSVGLQVHDAVSNKLIKNPVIRKGMVLTIEPGIYLPCRFGMRIEDTIVLTDDGCKVLTKNTPKELVFIRR